MGTAFPRSEKYNPQWLLASVSGAANPLWLCEWLAQAMDLRAGMHVLDLGCGRAVSSIFLHREFGVKVWAADLWFDPQENQQRIRDAGAEGGVIPVRANARDLPFEPDQFDAIVSIDSFPYYGTDDLYLAYIARFLKPGGQLGHAGSGFMQEVDGAVPDHLAKWWDPSLWCLHSPQWWRRHWDRTGIVAVETADAMPDGWRVWLEWHHQIAPNNAVEIQALEGDQGKHLGYVRAVGRRTALKLEAPVTFLPAQYTHVPMLRGGK